MKLDEVKLTIPVKKPRDPNHLVLANKKNAAGPMVDKKKASKNGDTKHADKKIMEAARGEYQVRVDSETTTGDWRDLELGAASLDDIVASVNAHPSDEKAIARFGLHELVSLVTNFIGDGANSRGSDRGSWDEMDFEIKSFRDDVLKVEWHFGGVDMSRLEDGRRGRKYGTPVSRSGTITIMPAVDAVKEAVAGPFEKFSHGDRVKVKKTGQEVTVQAQDEIGLVYTEADDAFAVGNKKFAQAHGYGRYMPKELERVAKK